jgi:DegV family protein with EDD domain
MKIKLIADSTCDLSADLTAKHDIRIVPLSISKGDEVLKDGIEISSRDIFDYVESGKGICRTSAVNIEEYREIYEEERPLCDAIIHFTISAEMSACYQNALLAAEEFDNIFIIDTRNLSTAIGHLVLDAADLIAQNLPAKEIHEELLRRIPLLDASFIIDTLDYLHKGGRCTALQAVASSMLKIKPCIIVADGKMTVGKKYRGKLDAVLKNYVTDKLNENNINKRRLFITHTLDAQNYALLETVKKQVLKILPFEEIFVTRAGGTISCHCGPNTLGILFYRKG